MGLVLHIIVGVGLGILILHCAIWAWYSLTGRGIETPEKTTDIQVRFITTGDAVPALKESLETVPDKYKTVIVSEEPIPEITDTPVKIVPDDFDCKAVAKGRAQEWARRNIECNEDFVLYLDEDSKLPDDFDGIPAGDVVQLRQRPQKSGSHLMWLADMLRIGTAGEMKGFQKYFPIYSWGGALAIRKTVEDDVTWNRKTLVEDVAFNWVARKKGYSYHIADHLIDHQSPPSIIPIIEQRRRWSSGRLQTMDEYVDSPLTRFVLKFKVVGYSTSVFMLPLVVLGLLLSPWYPMLGVLAGGVIGCNVLWCYLGWKRYDDVSVFVLFQMILLMGVLNALNGVGNLYSIISPASSYVVTEKSD